MVSVPSQLTVGKLMDRASTGMLGRLASVNEATVRLWMSDVSEKPFRLEITLERARFSEYDAKFNSTEKSVSVEEEWTLDYRKIKFAYFLGNKPGPQVELNTARVGLARQGEGRSWQQGRSHQVHQRSAGKRGTIRVSRDFGKR